FVAAHISVSHAYVHLVDFGLPVKVGGLWVKPGDLVHADQHGVVTIPSDLAPKIPDAVAKIEATERRIISLCQSREFSAERLQPRPPLGRPRGAPRTLRARPGRARGALARRRDRAPLRRALPRSREATRPGRRGL